MNFGKFDGESEALNPPLEAYDTFFCGIWRRGDARPGWKAHERDSDPFDGTGGTRKRARGFAWRAIANFYRQWEEDAKVKKTERFYNCCVLEYTFEDGRFVLERIVNPNRPEGD